MAAVGSGFSPTFNSSTGDNQFGFIQSNFPTASSISQNATLASGTTYTVSFYAEGRPSYVANPLSVYLVPGSGNLDTTTAGTLNLTSSGTLNPGVGSWSQYTLTGTIPAGAGGTYTLDFLGSAINDGGNSTSFIDDVTVSSTPSYSTQVLSPTSAAILSTYSATLSLNDNSQTIGSLTGIGTVQLGALSTTTLTIGADNTTPAAFTGTIFGSGGITKIGTGTLTLGSTNYFSGPTTVAAGTLLLANGSSGSATGSGPVTVESGATLAVNVAGGGGEISPQGGNTVTVNTGGNLALANGVTLRLPGGLTLEPGVTTSADLSGTPNGSGSSTPLLAVTGGNLIATSGNYVVNFVGNPSAGTYDLIDFAGSNPSGSGSFAIGAVPAGFAYQLQLNVEAEEVDLVTTAGDFVITPSTDLSTTTGLAVGNGAAITLSGGVSVGSIPLSLSGPGLSGNPAVRSG